MQWNKITINISIRAKCRFDFHNGVHSILRFVVVKVVLVLINRDVEFDVLFEIIVIGNNELWLFREDAGIAGWLLQKESSPFGVWWFFVFLSAWECEEYFGGGWQFSWGSWGSILLFF